jgi:hypothetical protein
MFIGSIIIGGIAILITAGVYMLIPRINRGE